MKATVLKFQQSAILFAVKEDCYIVSCLISCEKIFRLLLLLRPNNLLVMWPPWVKCGDVSVQKKCFHDTISTHLDMDKAEIPPHEIVKTPEPY